jgi:hypothetical protein
LEVQGRGKENGGAMIREGANGEGRVKVDTMAWFIQH